MGDKFVNVAVPKDFDPSTILWPLAQRIDGTSGVAAGLKN